MASAPPPDAFLDKAAPTSISKCIGPNGELILDLYMEFASAEADAHAISHANSMQLQQQLAMWSMILEEQEANDDGLEGPPQKKRRLPKGVVWYTDEEGVRRVLPPTMSLWYNLYVESANPSNPRFEKSFRRRFRLPYSNYLELVQWAIDSEKYFARWKPGKMDAVGNPCAPINLLVLCALRYLGRGWTFDDLCESTGISEEVIRVFFHEFIRFGSEEVFEKFVKTPSRTQEGEAQAHEFALAGFPGCIGSMDATHIALEKVTYRLRQAHLAKKVPYTARTYNLVVNHRRRILSTTEGHPARWNDKTLVNFDEFVMAMKNGQVLDGISFELYDYDEGGNVIRVKYRGAWLLVDNGYHNWAITVPPMKRTTRRTEIRFSQWLESMRKDVECTFGILKGRWRVLKAGIRIHGIEDADRIWKTCCALHNWLLEIDGLDSQWEAGARSDWEGELGQHDSQDVHFIPTAIDRLLNPAEARNYDTSGIGPGDDRSTASSVVAEEDEDEAAVAVVAPDGRRVVRRMTMKVFRAKLVTHFDIAFKRQEIRWPTRHGTVAPTLPTYVDV